MAANSRMFYVFAFVFMALSCWFPSNADLQPADLLSEAKSLDTADTSAIEYVLQVRRNATATQKKLSGDLMVKSASLHMSLTSTPSRVMRNSLQTITKDEIADVNIKCITSDRLVARIKELGGEVISRSDRFGSIHARVPLSRLEVLAADTDVKKVKTVVKPMLNKANVSEGVVSHRVAQVFSAYDITGRGVKVGVISDSSRYLSDVQASGDLPNDVIVLPGLDGAIYMDGERCDTGEGTAMMEIVHDLAPGAQLYFATAGHTEEEMAESILALKAAGCSIIVDDICFYSEAVFQDGIVARTVNAVAEEGCIYVTCAANKGNLDSGKSGVWEGDFSPGGTTVSLDDETWEAHQFAYGSEVAKWNPLNGALTQAYGAYGMPLRIDLQWSDPLDGACNDYAIGLYDTESRTLIGWSVDVQDGDDDPHDSVLIYPEITTKYPYLGIAIFKKAGAASRHLHLSVFQQAEDDSPGWFLIGTDGHVYGHNAAESAISVGAAKQVSGRAFNSADTADYYSSDGPRRMFYREDGTPYTSSLLSDGGIVLNKPDVTAASTVSCATSGFNPFPGTSAAAPHVAAIVALMLEANPELSLPDIRSILAGSTHSTGGWNRTMGYGIVDAYWAVEEARYYGLPRMVTPTLTSGQIFFGGLAVTATSSDSGATLRYTADGSEPNEGSAQWPSEGLVLSSSATVTVRAFKDGYRPSRAVSAIYTKGNVPSAPTVSLSGTTLSWTAPSGANYYRVYRSTNPYSEPLPYSGWITGLSYTVAQPSSEGTVYFYTVKAAATADEATASPFSDTGKALVYSAYTEVHMYGASSFSVTPVLNSSEVFQNMKFHVTSGSSSAITGTISGPNGTQDIATSPTIGASSGSLVIARYTFAVSGTANSSTMPRSYGFYTTYSVPSGWSNSSGKSYAQAVWLAHPHYYYQAGATAFSIGQTSQSVEAEGGAFSTTVSATPLATTWSVEASGDWIVPYRTSQSGSATLGYFVAPNTSSQERTGTLTFTQGSTTKTLTVTQAGTTPAVLPNLYPYRPQGWSAPLVVAASPENSTNSTATTFLTTDDLYASLALACSGASATERLIAALYVDGTRKHRWSWDNGIAMGHYGYVVGYSLGLLSAGTHTIELVCDSENAIAESDESDNTYSITVTVVDGDPGPDNPDPEEPELRLEGYYHDFGASCNETAFDVICNGSWTAYPTVEWVTITHNASGHGNGTVGFAVSANTSTSSRTGSIVVTCGTVSQTWEITQEGASVSLDIRTEIVDGIEWSYFVKNGEAWIYSEEGSAVSDLVQGDIVVPQTIGDCPVAGILDRAFFDCCGITSVTIPAGVTRIGDGAFLGCGRLRSVSIPDSVTSLGWFAFQDCTELATVVIPTGVKYIGEATFANCRSLTGITMPVGVTEIGVYAFAHSGLTDISIPDSVTDICYWAFGNCDKLTNVVFMGDAPWIEEPWGEGDDAFSGVPSSCVVHVRRGSTGWGVDIPGTWHGMHIEYLDEETPPEDLVAEVEAPTASPGDGAIFTSETCVVTLDCATGGATIYYTTNGVTPRLTAAYAYSGPFVITGTCTIKAVAVLDGVKSEYMTATITKRTLTLAEAASADTTSASLQFTTGGDSDWMPIGDATAATGLSAQSGVIGDEAETWMQTSVSGAGTFSFRWKVDCEWDDSGDMTWDHVAVFTNGVEAARMDGTSGWEDMSFVFADAGTHTVRWTFVKDDYDEEDADSADCAWVSGVTYTPSGPVDAVVTVGGREVTVPRTWLAAHENIVRNSGGDVTAALLATAANGRLSNVECYVLGLDPEVATNDFKIVSFPMKADGTPDIDNIVFEPPQAQWNVPATWKVKGAATLEGPWEEVSDDGGAGRAALPLRFFKMEVVLP